MDDDDLVRELHSLRDEVRRLDRAHRQLRQAERLANIGSWRLTLDDRQTEWSDQTYAIHGLPVGSRWPLQNALDFYPPHDRMVIADAVAQAIANGTPFDVEVDFTTAQGEYRRVRSMGEVELADGRPVALIGVFQDITDRHLLEQELRRAVAVDPLTQIGSRAHFNIAADRAVADAVRDATPLALLLIDLDRFKDVNDRFGHAAGDEVLQIMAARMIAPDLAGSLAARLGGDEFALVLTAPSLLADLRGSIGRLLAGLRHTVTGDGDAIVVSATIGACRLNEQAQSRGLLAKHADGALYAAKRIRRGTAMIHGEAGPIFAG